MADALFQTDDYSPANLRMLAESLHLDLPRYDANWKDPAITKQLDQTRRWIKS